MLSCPLLTASNKGVFPKLSTSKIMKWSKLVQMTSESKFKRGRKFTWKVNLNAFFNKKASYIFMSFRCSKMLFLPKNLLGYFTFFKIVKFKNIPVVTFHQSSSCLGQLQLELSFLAETNLRYKRNYWPLRQVVPLVSQYAL